MDFSQDLRVYRLAFTKGVVMPSKERKKTKYPGVVYIEVEHPSGKKEKAFYIRYRKNGQQIEERAGYQFRNKMTSALAARIRAERIDGGLSNEERREKQKSATNRWTFDRLWDEYLSTKDNLKGIRTDKNRYELHIKPVFGSKEPKDIAPLDVDRLRLKLLKTKKPGTVKNVLELLRRISNFGVKKKLCPGLSFTIEMPHVDNEKTENLTPAQLKSLLEAIYQTPHIQCGQMMLMVLFTGLRRSEIFRLEWRDIDYQNNFIWLRDPKGGKSTHVPLNDAAKELLLSIPETDSPFIFPGRGGKMRVDAHHQMNQIKKAAELPKDFRVLHGLRHVYASNLASDGVDLYTISKLLTHKSPNLTSRYAHLSDQAMKNASERAGQLVTGASGNRDNVKNLKQKSSNKGGKKKQ